ncbi:MAG TPA: SH3 domain-containing protein [Victivallales bacterium]|nr:SH3 domain-containing protein [Victivallales bacterium]
MKMLITSFAILSACFATFAEESVDAVVNTDRLNVRVLPSVSHTAVAKFAKDDTVKVFAVRKGWCEVAVPENCNVWIAASDISADGIVLKESFLRSGPMVTYSPFSRKALKDEKLEILEKRSDWVKVSAPSGLRGWVSAKFVVISEEDAGKIPNDASTTEQALQTEPLSGLDFLPLPEKDASYEGVLLELKDGDIVKHALVIEINDGFATMCYLHSDTEKLDQWVNKKVKISGKEKWVRGWKRPLLVVDKITHLL